MSKQDSPKGMPPWHTKRRAKKFKNSSSTPGREKGLNCQATSLDKAMAKYPRSWKNDNRVLWKAWDLQCSQFWKH